MTLTYDLWPWPQNVALFLLITFEYLHAYVFWYGFWVIAIRRRSLVKVQGHPMTFDLDIFRCTICHLRWMVKVPSLYDKWFRSYKMFRKVGRKRVIRDTFRETFFWSMRHRLLVTILILTNQISDICYGFGLFSGPQCFLVAGSIIPLLMHRFLYGGLGGFLFEIVLRIPCR